MAYTLADIQSEVLRRIKDTSFSTELIKDYVQDIQDEVLGQKRFSFLESIGTTTITAGSLSHSYPADLQLLLGVKLVDPATNQTYTPDFVAQNVFEEMETNPSQAAAGLPSAYTDYGRGLYWDRPTDKDYQLILKYQKAPTRLETPESVPDIPQEYKGILIQGALAGVEEYRGNEDIASLRRRKVEDLTRDMLRRYNIRQAYEPHTYSSAFPTRRYGRHYNPDAKWRLG